MPGVVVREAGAAVRRRAGAVGLAEARVAVETPQRAAGAGELERATELPGPMAAAAMCGPGAAGRGAESGGQPGCPASARARPPPGSPKGRLSAAAAGPSPAAPSPAAFGRASWGAGPLATNPSPEWLSFLLGLQFKLILTAQDLVIRALARCLCDRTSTALPGKPDSFI